MSHALTDIRLSVLSNADRLPALANWAVVVAVAVTKWDARHRTRKHLSKMPHHLLSDVGLDPVTAAREAAKPFWRD
ncbi:DUF1127 domain-containing protein [Pseudooctadecabacter jejudonensis]|uniref:YjiS-like domain-containing protein n=1 Tax=Pseudooctadecabacter jejudonensis TaxID=1391910 RepID=A0A1Y5RDX0_9RHOB|nr:DUF1127 domain-containing protein [Pseudooctadecabacter jejudonensis]SLN15186.1 hypothetical protein PSJ8397_00337 [Pseudooctadecabacter jejudonensis]